MSHIIISDWLAWGRLLKTWTTERSYFADSKVYRRPRTLAELKAQLAECGAGSVPDWVIDFELVAWSQEKLRIELPSSAMIQNAEMLLKTGTPYPLPAFYRDALGDTVGEVAQLRDAHARLAFHTMRVGEHAVNAFG